MRPEIRQAADSDVVELQRYATGLFSENLPGIFRRPPPTLDEEYEFVRSRIEPPNSTLLVAVLGGRIVGLLDFAGGTLAEESHVGTFGLSVDRGHRGHGIGTALIEALVSWAPEHGISRIQAWAWANNPQAVALYERLGFVQEGLCKRAIISDGEPVDVKLLALLLVA